MTTYFVATDGNNSTGNGSRETPWKSINKAVREASPGDEIIVRAGTYNEAVSIGKSGTAGNYLTIRSEDYGTAKIVPPANSAGITIDGNYVKVIGFEVSGSDLTGIRGSGVHHVEVLHNVVHDNVNDGIFLGRGDYWLIEGNVVYGNAAAGGSSGIHLKAAYNITGNNTDTNFRIIVRDNAAYGNERQWGAMTDGNGIILDDFNNTQVPELPPYTKTTLVAGNIAYANTGRGIQVAWSDHATIRDNVAFHNNADARSGLWRGELSNMGTSHTTWVGNVAVSNSVGADNPAIANVSFVDMPPNTNVIWTGNLTFNGTVGFQSVYTNNGNIRPTAAQNQLGVDPHLTAGAVVGMGSQVTTPPDGMFYNDPDPDDPDPQIVYNLIGGTSGNDVLIGGAGHDSIVGAQGHDSLVGNGGHDILVGGNGIDTLVGGDGNDTFVYGHHSTANNGDVIADFANGDVIDLSGMDANIWPAAPGNQDFAFIGANAFSGTAGELRYAGGVLSGDVNGDGTRDFFITIANNYALGVSDMLGVELGNTDPDDPDDPGDPGGGYSMLGGTPGNDVLIGGAGRDSIVGAGGHDSLVGNGGDDILIGGNGIDTLVGGAGKDTFVYGHHSTANNGDVIADFANGDVIDLSGMDANIWPAAPGNQDFAFIGANAFSGTAGELRYAGGVLSGDVNGDGTRDFFITIANNYALGVGDMLGVELGSADPGDPDEPDEPGDPGGGYRMLGGTSGNDVLIGGAGRDSIIGANGHDSLVGNGGDDILIGGNGIDTLVGGAGKDTFVYGHHSTANNGDVIADFANGDVIDLSGMDANIWPAAPGNQDFAFIGANAFSGTAGELRYAGGVLSGDVNGDGNRDFFITIANNYALDAADLIL